MYEQGVESATHDLAALVYETGYDLDVALGDIKQRTEIRYRELERKNKNS